VVVIHTRLTEQLIDEGLEREVLSKIQSVRKEMSLGFTERIRVAVEGSERIKKVCSDASARIGKEVLASEFAIGAPAFEPEVTKEGDLDGEKLVISIRRA